MKNDHNPANNMMFPFLAKKKRKVKKNVKYQSREKNNSEVWNYDLLS